MIVKQIDLREALKLVANGHEVKVMVPSIPEQEKWTDYEPDTLQNMLDGCLFFRTEPAMEVSGLKADLQAPGVPPPDDEGAAAGTAKGAGKPSGKRMAAGAKRKPVDTGKLMALHTAGWSNVKIADELGISDATVGKYIKQLKEEKKDGQTDS